MSFQYMSKSTNIYTTCWVYIQHTQFQKVCKNQHNMKEKFLLEGVILITSEYMDNSPWQQYMHGKAMCNIYIYITSVLTIKLKHILVQQYCFGKKDWSFRS